jgi:hypothetical protein
VVLSPGPGERLAAGDTYTIAWLGGKLEGGMVALQYKRANDATWKSGFGLPDGVVSNSGNGTFVWSIDPGVPSATDYQVMISSATDPFNYAISSGTFAVKGSLPDFQWVLGKWSACPVSCGGGTMCRTRSCVDTMAPSNNTTPAKGSGAVFTFLGTEYEMGYATYASNCATTSWKRVEYLQDSGCASSHYVGLAVKGSLVLINRGGCSFVKKSRK